MSYWLVSTEDCGSLFVAETFVSAIANIRDWAESNSYAGVGDPEKREKPFPDSNDFWTVDLFDVTDSGEEYFSHWLIVEEVEFRSYVETSAYLETFDPMNDIPAFLRRQAD